MYPRYKNQREYQKNYYKKNKEKRKKIAKEWAEKNRIKCRGSVRKWAIKNQDKIKNYRITHRNEYNKWLREYRKNPKIKINNSIRCAIWYALKGKKNYKKWQEYVGYTLDELIKHLENNFSEGMNWDNYGSYWQIDHIVPQKNFNYTSMTEIEFRKCWELNNLRPLTTKENRIKGARLL